MLPLRLHAKFLVIILGSLVLLLGLVFFALLEREARLFREQAEEKQHLLALTVSTEMKEAMLQGSPRSAIAFMDSLRNHHGLVRLDVLRKDGSPAFGRDGERTPIAGLARVFESGEEFSFEEKGDRPLHTILQPLRNEQACRACHAREGRVLGALVVTLSLEDSQREMAVSTRRLVFFFLAVVLALGSGLYLLVRMVILKPLDALHAGAERIGSGELSHRIEVNTGDELQELAGSMNLMAARIEESYTGLEQRIRERTDEVENKARRLYEYSRDLAAISAISTKIFNAEQTMEEMLEGIMRAVRRGLGYDQAMLCLIDRSSGMLRVKQDSGLAEVLGTADRSISGPDPFAAVIRTGQELFIEDAALHPAFRHASPAGQRLSLQIMPILTGTHDKLCWQANNCIKTGCPAYKREDERCWLLPATHCSAILAESYDDKLAYCMSCAVFPVLGVLIVAVPPERPFRRHHVAALRVLAAEIGAAFENHRLHEDNKQLVRQLLELYRVIAEALAELSLDRALDAFTEAALKFPGLDACNFWLLTGDGEGLERRAGGCTDQSKMAGFLTRLPADQGVLGRSLRTSQIVVEYNAPHNDPTDLGKMSAARGLPAILALPLKTERGPIGVFSVHKKGPAPFLENDIASFMLIANHAAMAIHVCMLSDELKRQNRELARSTGLMGEILSSMSSGVLLIDNRGVIQLVNTFGALLLNVRPEELLHRPIGEVIPDAAVFQSSPVGPYHETEITKRDGTAVAVGFSTAYYNGPSGAPEGVIVAFRDLTEIKALQAAVLTKERFATMGQLVAGVAHEIRNPLFGINSIGQIFERELTDAGHLELVRALLSETKRMKQLVEGLLIYGRPARLQYGQCNLRELWDEVIGLHREEVRQKGITLTDDFSLSRANAYLDGGQIRQVFQNLFRNAIDATPANGEIAIRLLLEDRFIIFQISDTGPGIPGEDRERVFELFYSTKPKGSGLGLPISRKIIEDHGGEILLGDGQREGTGKRTGLTVTVKLPYRRAE